MGGLAFVFAATIASAIFVKKADKTLVITLAISLSFMAVGFLDDFLKRKHHENLGLKAWQKFSFQIIVAILAGFFCYRSGLTELHLPFLKRSIDIGYWIFPLSVIAFVATVNAVNLTDGLDGLAAGACVPFFLTLGVLILLQGENDFFSILSFLLVGSLLGYLCFNVYPASVFMGDTGSLALGGFAAGIGVFSGNALYLLVNGMVFVFSVISVIMQVVYYKVTKGKRIFLMAPIHHHFQKKGFSESKISYVYFIVTLMLGLLSIVTEL
jgi:phospho-N-acetylmuramoyl-pentapeptide-transferase